MFKDIKGYDGYKVNENGIIINKKGHMMRPALLSGRARVALEVYDDNGKLLHRDNLFVSRVVASTFIPNPNNLPIVMHKDNDPLHNHVSNLRWGTYKENSQQCIAENRRPANTFTQKTEYLVTNGDETIKCKGTKGVAELTGLRFVTPDVIIRSGKYKGYKVIDTHKKIPTAFIHLKSPFE